MLIHANVKPLVGTLFKPHYNLGALELNSLDPLVRQTDYMPNGMVEWTLILVI